MVWAGQPDAFFEQATLDMDGSLVETTGECKQGMDIAYDGTWGYHPLVLSLANTGEVLSIVNRSGNRPSHEGAAALVDQATAVCFRGGFRRVLLRGLREATNKYTKGGGKGTPAPNVEETAVPLFHGCLAEVRAILPEGKNYGGWRKMSPIEMEDLYAFVYGHLAEDDERRDHFLQAELRLTSAFLLVKHLDDCRAFADEIIFYQRVRNQILKALPGKKPVKDIERAVRDLVDDSVETEGVVDIFKAAGIEKADLSILDDKFLQTFKDQPLPNLRLEAAGKADPRRDPVAEEEKPGQGEVVPGTARKYAAALPQSAHRRSGGGEGAAGNPQGVQDRLCVAKQG